MESMHTDVRVKRVRKEFTSNIILAIKPLFASITQFLAYESIKSLTNSKYLSKDFFVSKQMEKSSH